MKLGFITASPKVADLYTEALAGHSYALLPYETLSEAVNAILTTRFDNTPLPCDILVIAQPDDKTLVSDIQRLRLFLTPHALPIIILSGTHDSHFQELDLHVLTRPGSPAALLQTLEQLAATRDAARENAAD
ncbi:MAG TPA: hypothetical protein VHD63_24070 [Ktedonobacteraceae bacterium]|nr:hypothetical protein [Ktedonobacteraceae bacterium]